VLCREIASLAAAARSPPPAAPASTEAAPDQDAADALRISATMSDGSDTLSPGDSFDWTVDIAAAEDLAGTIDRELVVDGAIALGAWFLTAASRRRRAEPAPAEIPEEQTT